jgi:DNA primase
LFIPKETINEIRDRIDIVRIVEHYVPSLKKTGNSYTGLCPFHSEKTPSFTVSPGKNLFHCFGCHASGNAFTFLSRIEGLTFPESVKRAAELSGIHIDIKESGTDNRKRDYSLKINRFTSQLYHKYLLSENGQPGLSYLETRGISRESIEGFKLGYAPDEWDFLASRLQKRDIDLSQAVETGVINSKERPGNTRYYDRFRNRIIFPIHYQGEVRGFGGRLTGDGKPKYLNSPDSDLFHKRSLLYGYDEALTAIRELKRVIVVEGYLDVIGLHQEGVRNVVAPLGTALTEEHVERLGRLADEIVLLFDADDAGRSAASRTLEFFHESPARVRVARLPWGDPLDYVQQKGIRELMVVVDSAEKPATYLLEEILEQGDREDLPGLLKPAFSLLNTLSMESERDEYLRYLGRKLSVDMNSLKRDFEKFRRDSRSRESHPEKYVSGTRDDYRIRAYQELLGLLIRYPGLMDKAVIDFNPRDVPEPVLRKIFETMFSLYTEERELKPDKLFDIFPHGSEEDMLEKACGEIFNEETPEDVYTEIYINLRLYEITRKIETFAAQVADSNINQSIITEIEILRREKEKLTRYLYEKGTKSKLSV